MFRYIKAHGEQPGEQFFCLPSALASFTPFALRSLGQEVFCSVQEADYEIASYAHQHSSMGILGQDSDFIIYDSAPYLSVTKLRLDGLTTVLYNRQNLCRAIGLTSNQLPLLACLLGNDVVSEERMQHIRSDAMTTYRNSSLSPRCGAPQGQMVLAVSQLINSLSGREEEKPVLIPPSLKLSAPDRELLERGICSYLLPAQDTLQRGDISTTRAGSAFVMERVVSPEIIKACREKHIAAEGFMVYSVICAGVVQCSNSLEDGEDTELLPQALVYKPCRQNIYGLLLCSQDGNSVGHPVVREWFVYPGNPLKGPDIVQPVSLLLPCDWPSLDLLWFGTDPEVSGLRLMAFTSIFDCHEFSELCGSVEDTLLAALCLVTYIILQVKTLSLEDMDAYLSQAVCLRLKSHQELQDIKLPFLSSRAVQLGSLYVRGLSHLLGANCASGCPLPSDALMPWHSFDGRLFHSKYLLAHSGTEDTVLLDGDSSSLSVFRYLREKVTEICRKRSRVLQSRPRPPFPQQSRETTSEPRCWDRHSGQPSYCGPGWKERDVEGGHQFGWRERGETTGSESRENVWERGRHQFRALQQHDVHSYLNPSCHVGRVHNSTRPANQSRGRAYQANRGKYRLAPRWSGPPAPGT
ncbi:constitutive coactivator of peroxisome proliferator-activated receptor gamma isoform X2 [Thalassophryne amazonica]|nr:constitutive coactivator of peroxisome proliferator-activated receptor gamma isoform X2 [Thalassophryne amazonica]